LEWIFADWKLAEVDRPFIEQLTAMGWCYVAGDLDNRRGA